MTDTSTSQKQVDTTDIFAPILAPLNNPIFIGYFALLVFFAGLSVFSGVNKPKVHGGRFATRREIRRARKIGLRQMARQIPKEPALELDSLLLPSLAPAVAIIGGSGSGKTRTFFDPGIKSAIDQGWTNLVLDVKGNLMRKHAAYAHSKGYDVYVYAPGKEYSDGLNFLDFLKNEEDAKAANELATVINENLKRHGTDKGDDFFTPQGIGLLKSVFMLAKGSSFPDIFTAWKFLSLDGLAERLQAAQEYGLFNAEGNQLAASINTWIGESVLPLRSVSPAPETSVGIVGSATTNFQKIVDKSLMPCLLHSTIPLDLTGKQIVFYQVDEEALGVTSPLVAAAMNMHFYRNLNGMVKRENTCAVFLDEVGSVLFPNLEPLVNRCREYGALFALGYQSNAQLELQYSEKYLQAILASCPTKMIFRTGDPKTAEKFSAAYGHTDKIFKTESRAYGKNHQRSTTEHVQKVRLVTPEELDYQMEQGECVTTNPEFKGRPSKQKVRIKQKNDDLWTRATEAWNKEVCPTLIEQAQQRYKDTTMEVEKSDREVIANAILPTREKLKAHQTARELRAKIAALG